MDMRSVGSFYMFFVFLWEPSTYLFKHDALLNHVLYVMLGFSLLIKVVVYVYSCQTVEFMRTKNGLMLLFCV